ncbi:MAG: hypothetical protein AABX66_04410 [Nanoarchaeota archaeon]
MKYLGFIILLLLFGAFFIVSNENLALKDVNKRTIFAREYYGWFIGVLGNVKTITGNVISLNWLPNNTKVITNNTLKKK